MSTTSYSLVSLRVGPSVTLEHVMLEWGRTDGSQGSQKVEDCQSTHHRPFSSLLLVLCVCCSIPTKSPNAGDQLELLVCSAGAWTQHPTRWMDDCATPKDPTNRPPPTKSFLPRPDDRPTNPLPPPERGQKTQAHTPLARSKVYFCTWTCHVFCRNTDFWRLNHCWRCFYLIYFCSITTAWWISNLTHTQYIL